MFGLRGLFSGLCLTSAVGLAACAGDAPTSTTLTTFGGTDGAGSDSGSTSLTTGISGSESAGSGDSGEGSTTLGDTGSVDSSSSGADTGSDTTTGEPDCEPADADIPDVNGLDENGDGIDGVVCRAVFVDLTIGSDLNDGIFPDEPVATIGRGIEIAQTYDPPRMVLVAAGTYAETVNLKSGVSLYGGYSSGDWDRDHVGNVTEIAGTEARTLIGQNLDQPVEVDGFTITARSFVDGGQSTYGVWIRDVPEDLLHIDYLTIVAGDGGKGNDGVVGQAGDDGDHGTSAEDANPGVGGTSSCGATGGNGGSGQACPSTKGGDGSAGGDPTTVGQGGAAGTSHCGGNDCGDEGADGSPGLPGHHGVNGSGGAAAPSNKGTFGGDGLWAPPVGALATRGNHGSGGGGGGAGGFDVDSGIACLFDSGNGYGGGGGGGGAGGCGGQPGGLGGAGGGSFGLVVIASSIRVTDTDIVMGRGGDGGNGGKGGNGGSPGQPGAGDQGVDDGGEPGNGRDGAPGGGGGGGGGGAGGCGGASVGIARVDGAATALNNVAFTPGEGGTGGLGGPGGFRADGQQLQAPEGAKGCNGFVADHADF